MDAGSDDPPRPSATGTEASPVPAAAGELPARRRRDGAVASTGAGATGAAAVKGGAAGAGSGKGAAGTVSVTRAAVRAGEAALSAGAGRSSQSSSPGSTTRPPPDDDRPYSAARRSASAASAAASMGRPASCGSGTGAAVTDPPADAEEASAVFLRPRPPEADARPAREEALRPAAGRGCSSPGTDTAASATAASRTATDPAAGGAVRSTAPDAGAGPVSGTGAAFELPARRRRGEVFVAGTGAGAAGGAAVKGGAAGTGSGQGVAGTVSVAWAAVRAGEAALSAGAGRSSQSSSPGSTTRPPPDDDRPYSAARRSASAASAAASMGRPASCGSGTGAAVTDPPADAEEASAVFLRPRPPEADARPAREEALRPAAGRGCSSPGTDTAASATAASRTATDPAAGGAVCSTAPDAGAGPVSATGSAFVLPARRRRAVVFWGEMAGSGDAAADVVPVEGPSGGVTGAVSLPSETPCDASSCGTASATSRGALSGAARFFRPLSRSREGAGLAVCCASRPSAGVFSTGNTPCVAFFPFPAVFSGREGDSSRPQASNNERAVAVMTVTRLRDNRLLESSPAAGDRPGAASEGEDMELLDYIQIG